MTTATADLVKGLADAIVELDVPPIRWEALTDDQAWELMVTRPRILGRWSRPSSGLFVRRDPDGDRAVVVRLDRNAKTWGAHVSAMTHARRLAFERVSFPSAAAAIAAADSALRCLGIRLLDGGDEGLAEGTP